MPRRASSCLSRACKKTLRQNRRELRKVTRLPNRAVRRPQLGTPSRRASQARNQDFRAHRFSHPADDQTAPVTELEDLSTEHLGEIVAIDFFTVPTVRMHVLFVFIVLEHQRRKVLHFGVTEHPTSEWVGQQVVEAFAEREAPRYLIRDRDASYGNEFRRRVQSLGVKEVITAPRSPWPNAFAEGRIG